MVFVIGYSNKSNIRQSIQPIFNYSANQSLDVNDIASSLPRTAEDVDSLIQSATTNNLPLNLEYFDLNSSGFKEIGHIENFDDSLLLMDRHGSFFKFKNNNITNLNFSVPNNINGYYSEHGIGNADMRSFSFVVDCDDSKIYASFMKYAGNDKGYISLQSTKFNCFSNMHFEQSIWSEIYLSNKLNLSYLKGSHNGGGGLAQDQSNLYLSIGFTDGVGNENDIVDLVAQDLSSERGKVLKINKNNNDVQILSSGHRNLQDLIILKYPDEEKIYAIEQGPQGGDEINHIQENNNYGWPLATYGTRYGSFDHDYNYKKILDKKVFTEPVFSFVPSIAGCSILEVNGFDKEWNRDILIGALKARSIYRLKIKDHKVLFSEHIWIGKRIRSLAQIKNKIFALTDDNFLISISVNQEALNNNSKYNDSYAFDSSLQKCLSCHGLSETSPTSRAPSLKNIVGRDIASTIFPYYSASLSSMDGVWSKENLSLFLSNPENFVSGSSMPKIDLGPDEIKAVIKTLDEYSK